MIVDELQRRASVDGSDHHDAFPVTVRAVRRGADDVVVLDLVRPAGAESAGLPTWEPGAHIDVVLGPDLERQYSLCGDPREPTAWRIAVLREPDSRGGSRRLHDEIGVGAELVVRGPRNEFPLDAGDRHLLIAGGIGITPLLPMVRELAATGSDWRLVYGGRRASSMAFLDELAAYGDRVTVWPEDQNGLLDLTGLLGAPQPGTQVYCCGPSALIDAVEERCAGWPHGALHVERFRPKAGALDGEATAFEVHLDSSDITLTIAPDQTIAEAVEAAGIDIMTSCREGTCGTCETTVLEGVPDHRDSLLTDDEKAANDTMMICCSRSLTARLVLDL